MGVNGAFDIQLYASEASPALIWIRKQARFARFSGAGNAPPRPAKLGPSAPCRHPQSALV